MKHRMGWLTAVTAMVTAWAGVAPAQQKADPDFDAAVARPAFTADGPRVLFDEAHQNFHTAEGRFKPFADLVRNDGFGITPNREPFSAERLKDFDILVISNAQGPPRVGGGRRSDPAFTEAECDAVRDWVRGGGNLLLIADHYPMGAAAQGLALRFDVRMSTGMTDEFEFTADHGLAMDHPILRGRGPEERIRVLRTFTGQSLQGPKEATVLIALPPDGGEMTPDPQDPHRGKPIPGKVVYPAQGLAFAFGKGRVVVLGEAGMLTAQISPSGEKFGMNVSGIDNRQFALNTMRWLAGVLK